MYGEYGRTHCLPIAACRLWPYSESLVKSHKWRFFTEYFDNMTALPKAACTEAAMSYMTVKPIRANLNELRIIRQQEIDVSFLAVNVWRRYFLHCWWFGFQAIATDRHFPIVLYRVILSFQSELLQGVIAIRALPGALSSTTFLSCCWLSCPRWL